MPSPPQITLDDVRIVGIVCPVLAVIATTARLGERIRTRKWGWDDTWASICLAALIMFIFALFTFFGNIGNPANLQGPLGVAIFYMLSQGFYIVIWCARLSIISSVIRITPPGQQQKLFRYGSYIMGAFYCGLAIQTFVVCETNPSWKQLPLPQCPLGQQVAIAQLVTDILSDAMLIAAPVRLLWNVGTTAVQRNRLIAIFSSTIATTAVSLVHAAYIIMFGGLPEIFAAIIEMAVSLIVCSLPVLVPMILRLVGQDRHFKGATTQGNSQSYGMSTSSGKRTRTTQLESIGNFAPHPEYTSERVVVITGSHGPNPGLQHDNPSKGYGKDTFYPYRGDEDSSRHDSQPSFLPPFAYSSKQEEEAGRRGWAKGVQVAREAITRKSSDNDQYSYQARSAVRQSYKPHPPHSTGTDVEGQWGSGIQVTREEHVSRF